MQQPKPVGARLEDVKDHIDVEKASVLEKEPKEDLQKEPKPSGPRLTRIAIMALSVLTLQNCGAVLIMRYTLATPSENAYLTQTAVIMGEFIKTLASLAMITFGGADSGTLAGCFENRVELLKTGVPAALYLVQNNLQYVGVGNLQPATYQVTYQVKILSTALLSVLLLGTRLSAKQWGALVLLTLGVACVQVSEMEETAAKPGESVNIVLGLSATLAATVSSGLAGVYFEKILKGSSPLTLWQRNLQMGLYSMVIGLGGLLSTGQMERVVEDGFFQGYTPVTVFSIHVQALGGLVIAVVIKYADNIMKNFATALAIVLSCAVSVIMFDFKVSPLFVVGVVLVNSATGMYGGINCVSCIS